MNLIYRIVIGISAVASLAGSNMCFANPPSKFVNEIDAMIFEIALLTSPKEMVEHHSTLRNKISKANEELGVLKKAQQQDTKELERLTHQIELEKKSGGSYAQIKNVLQSIKKSEHEILVRQQHIAKRAMTIATAENNIADLIQDKMSGLTEQLRENVLKLATNNLSELHEMHAKGLFPDITKKTDIELDIALLGRQAKLDLSELNNAESSSELQNEILKRLLLNWLTVQRIIGGETSQSINTFSKRTATTLALAGWTAVNWSAFQLSFLHGQLDPSLYSTKAILTGIGIAAVAAIFKSITRGVISTNTTLASWARSPTAKRLLKTYFSDISAHFNSKDTGTAAKSLGEMLQRKAAAINAALGMTPISACEDALTNRQTAVVENLKSL